MSATLLGTVSDPSGATIAKAKVTATETATSVVYQTVTNDSGNYTFPDLKPGTYTVVIEAAGFKKDTHQNIDVLSNSSTRVDIDMVTGSVSETVLVTTAPPMLQTDRADISTKIESREVADLPLGTNRNFQSLLNLVPGTAPATFQHSQFFNAQSSLQTEVNGLPRQGNLYQIEGIDDDERTGLLQIIIPPAEAIQAVDISTNNFEAELGRATGAVTNVTLKSGANAFHGSAFEFIQNSAVNARSYFGGPLGHLSYNYFGGSIGGPIIKDKLFFFGDYLRTSDHEAVSNTLTIPPPVFYTNNNGFIDLSAPLKADGTGQIYDPATGDGSAGSPRAKFVNNQIPYSRVNQVSLNILQALGKVAQPNQNQSNIASPTNNYVTNLPFTKGTDSFDIKLDYTLNERNHLSGRYSYQRVLTFQAPAFGPFLGGPAGGGGFEAKGTQNSYSTGVNYDHVFSPTLFTEVRFGVAHLHNSAQPSDYGSNDATTLGIPGVNISGQPFTSGQVGITLNGGFSNPIIGYSPSVPWIRAESNIDIVNNWTKVIHNHTIKAGVDLRRVRDDLLQDQTFSPRGLYTFSENQTSNLGAKTNVANDMASFLLDVPSQVGRDLNTFFPAYRQWWFFAYASDKWQVTPKLTVDLGLRWEFYPPATPKIPSGFSNYDPIGNNLVLAGVGGNPSNMGLTTQYKYFAPRTGVSYRATDNTVIRAGLGVSFTPFPDNNYAYNYPVRANNAYNPTGSSSFTPAVLGDGVTTATFQAGFPAPVPIPIPSNGIIPAITSTLISQNYFYIPQNYKNPYVISWNVAVQQALPGSFSMQLAYVGNHGVDISGNQNINLPSTYGGGSAS
ncbi:MAG TPA: TonB-dependent receptor, partial [Edaphobacter sp.]